LYRYLRENSSWYKELNRYDDAIKRLEEEMKAVYKLNPIDKIDQISQKIEMLRTFMDLMN
ncbi:MAG: YlbE-like family protein, partial [bacterium]|nr:YlbE-like family protein [bacterium]